MLTRQQKRAQGRAILFAHVNPVMPRRYRREFARMASKVAFRQANDVWVNPFSRADASVNAKIRREATVLMDQEAEFLRRHAA